MKYPRAFSSVKIEEMTVTGNLPIKKMWERKIKWKTVDDSIWANESPYEEESGDTKVIKPMQIRVFSITFETKSSESNTISEIEEESFIII